ncbi:tetratricopeptide repeat protein [Haloechinothrix sp. LS1_15]|uniref:serine/threonine-protein kinase n=1 Tax=Haloechinothrix sp. LS1_15 TaxID=2652248 RepID=UPI002948A967|nr:tetratricopeptide repeat protein [Haloechinothrix sp. LS1_15]MDV6012038.1 protein kinase [Haloechinothrix sp. LS1_15]
MARCPRVGCAGEIDEDGFCGSCGLQADDAGRASTRTDSVATWSSPSVTTSSAPSQPGSSGRGMLGAGLVEVPPVPYRDPAEVVITDPEVPENQRFCARCQSPVGRSRPGRPARADGFCPQCGQRYRFTPAMQPGDVVHDQYEVLGCLAHGGLGWVYLARDRAVSGRWVVLKGLIDSADADATAAVIAERHFLAKVEHPNIVKIHNFVQQSESDGGSTGYIVMEYVGGQSLKDLVKQRRREEGPRASLPIEQALAYTIEALRPIGYLHDEGLLYCDVKPDNMVQTQELLKIIDLGAVRHVDDISAAVYGTVGYQAPEVAEQGPSVASDLYAMGRTLAVLSFPFDFTGRYATRLPPPSEAPPMAEHESFRRALLRACHPDPARRFASAAEMAEQLTGVLREVMAASDGQPRQAASAYFGPELRGFATGGESEPRKYRDDDRSAQASAAADGDVPTEQRQLRPLRPVDRTEVARELPVPRVDITDPAAELLTTLAAASPAELLESLHDVHPTSEVQLRRVRALIELDDHDQAWRQAELLADANSWRARWAVGLAALAVDLPERARGEFDAVLGELPGELAPKLALAVCAELLDDRTDAEHYYRLVWRTDRSFVSAAFGLARVLLRDGERAEAAAVLGSVPPSSAHHLAAAVAAVRVGTVTADTDVLTAEDLAAAGKRLADLDLDEASQAQVETELLESALRWTLERGDGHGDHVEVLGCSLTEHPLRRALEHRYRVRARYAGSLRERYALVDRANHVRPWTRT